MDPILPVILLYLAKNRHYFKSKKTVEAIIGKMVSKAASLACSIMW